MSRHCGPLFTALFRPSALYYTLPPPTMLPIVLSRSALFTTTPSWLHSTHFLSHLNTFTFSFVIFFVARGFASLHHAITASLFNPPNPPPILFSPQLQLHTRSGCESFTNTIQNLDTLQDVVLLTEERRHRKPDLPRGPRLPQGRHLLRRQ